VLIGGVVDGVVPVMFGEFCNNFYVFVVVGL